MRRLAMPVASLSVEGLHLQSTARLHSVTETTFESYIVH